MGRTTWSRRSFLRAAGGAGTIASVTRGFNLERVLAASESVAGRSAEDVAKDEFFWRQIQMDFKLDRTIINMNNGFTCPTPRVALESEMRYMEMINMAPIFYQGPIADRIQTIRLRMAEEFGCDPEEMALTRGASESLQIVQNGIDLKAGDEVVTTEQDYPRMLTTWDQRMRRDNIKVHRLQFPVPTTADDLYHRFEQAITPQTKVFHFCHVTNLTAQMFPVAAALPPRPLEGDRHHRRWRPRPGAISLQAAGPRVRRLRSESAQVAAGADRERLPLRSQGNDPAVLALAGCPRTAG